MSLGEGGVEGRGREVVGAVRRRKPLAAGGGGWGRRGAGRERCEEEEGVARFPVAQ